jgi:tetratricopeptide (TPR) repeat protein
MIRVWIATKEPRAFAEALGSYRACIALRPDDADAYFGLGYLLELQGDYAGAVAAYRNAVARNPKFNFVRNNLALALEKVGDLDGAIAVLRETVQLDPSFAKAHNNLARALQEKGDLDGAIAEYKEVLRLEPKDKFAFANLPRVVRMRELLHRLPGVLAGKDKPKTPAEMYELGHICSAPLQNRYVDAVRLFAEAFAADPKLAEDLNSGNRYNAACAAALGGCGKGKDSVTQKDKDRARLREQALKWLHADLALHRQHASAGESAARSDAAAKMAYWLEDSDLVGVRPGPNQVAMPAEERAAWDKLWADVKATLALAQKAVPATPGK